MLRWRKGSTAGKGGCGGWVIRTGAHRFCSANATSYMDISKVASSLAAVISVSFVDQGCSTRIWGRDHSNSRLAAATYSTGFAPNLACLMKLTGNCGVDARAQARKPMLKI